MPSKPNIFPLLSPACPWLKQGMRAPSVLLSLSAAAQCPGPWSRKRCLLLVWRAFCLLCLPPRIPPASWAGQAAAVGASWRKQTAIKELWGMESGESGRKFGQCQTPWCVIACLVPSRCPKVPEPTGSCPARPCLSEPLARSWLGPTAGLSHLRLNLGCVIRAGVVGKGAPREIIVLFLSPSVANSLRAYFSAVSWAVRPRVAFCTARPVGRWGGTCGTGWCWVGGLAKLKPVFIGTAWVDRAQEWISATAALSCTPGIQGRPNGPGSEALLFFSLLPRSRDWARGWECRRCRNSREWMGSGMSNLLDGVGLCLLFVELRLARPKKASFSLFKPVFPYTASWSGGRTSDLSATMQ